MRRFAPFITVLFVVFTLVGCGGSDGVSQAKDQPVEPRETETQEDYEVQEVHEVTMVGDEEGFYFEPEELTIEQGDKVKWTFESGAPHNVSFDYENYEGASIPDGAEELLKENGKFVSDNFAVPGQEFEIHFTPEYPAGQYKYVCEPHLASGMRGSLTIETNQ